MKKTCAVVLAISVAILWVGGCQEEQALSGEKEARLMAVENRDLQAQLQTEMKKKDDEIKKLSEQLKISQASIQAEIIKRDGEIKELNANIQDQMKKHDEDIRSVSRQLEQCQKAQDERVAKEINKQCQETVASQLNWIAELTAENERLKGGQADVNGETNK
jgi:hypothetical protein